MSGKRGTDEWNLETGANPEDQGCRGLPPEEQDVKAVSIQHCAATIAPRNCCPKCYAEQSKSWETTEAKEVQLSLAQQHPPALGLFWASFFLRVQHTSLLLISPGLCQFLFCVFSHVVSGNSQESQLIKVYISVHGNFVLRTFMSVRECCFNDVMCRFMFLKKVHGFMSRILFCLNVWV